MTPTGTGDRTMVLVDLSGTPRNRRLVRTVARQAVRLLTRREPTILVHSPAADGQAIRLPPGTRVVRSGDLIEPDAQARIQAWVAGCSWKLARDPGLWPRIEGISLGPLQVQPIQESLLSYGQVSEALARAVERERAGHCVVIAGYRELARALRNQARRCGVRASVVSLPARPRLGPGRRGSPGDVALPPLAEVTREPEALIVSESRPMSGMFDAVEAALRTRGTASVVRIEYGLTDRRGRGDRIWLRRPDHLPAQPMPVEPGVREALAAHRRESAESDGAAPLEFLVAALYGSAVPRQIDHLRQTLALLREIRPRLVVVGNDRWWIGMGWVLAARALGIPTLSIQDGVAWNTPSWWYATADRVAVNGSHLEGLLQDHGVDAGRISVVGQPRYDAMTPDLLDRRRLDARRRTGLRNGDFAVLFATQPNQDDAYVRTVVAAVLESADVHLLLRPHPSTEPAALDAARRLAAQNERIHLTGDADILDCMAAADLVVAQNSTVVLEAALLGKPVITANFTGLPEFVPYASLGISRQATTPARVSELVSAGARGEPGYDPYDPEVRRNIEFLIGPVDGAAADRVACLIQEFAAQPDPAFRILHDDLRS